MGRKAYILIILIMLSVFSSGCNLMPSPDNTIASPRPKKNISSNNDDINSIITGFIPSSAKLLVPKEAEDKNPIRYIDLNGDGNKEIILIFSDEKQIIKSGFMILKKGPDVWEKQFEDTDEYMTINLIDFIDITGDNLPEIFVGMDNILNIYHYNGKSYRLIKSINYTEYSSLDIPGKQGTDSMTELAVYNKVATEPGVNILRWNGYMLQDVSEEFPGYRQELVNYYKTLVNQNPNKSLYWFTLSKLQMDANEMDESLKSIDRAIFLESHPDTLVQYKIFKSRLLVNMGKYNEAIKLIDDDSVQRAPFISECKKVIAEIYFRQGDYIKSKELYKEIAVFPYDEDIQKVDAAIAEEKLYNYINSFGEKDLAKIHDSLIRFGNDNNIVVNSIIARSSVNELPNVLIVDYHISPVLAYEKDSVGAHIIYWWNNKKLYSKAYTTIGLYSNHHLDADFISTAASIKRDTRGNINMRITFKNNNKSNNGYPETLNQTFLFKNNGWKFYWK